MSRPLTLYRSILRFHRDRLPMEMRKLGDDYVKAEFQLHKSATNTTHIADFMKEWENYLESMKRTTGKFGRNMEKEEAGKLNDEQRIKLAQLRDEAKRME